MTDTTDLNAQIAQRLFGWAWKPKRGWHTAEGEWRRVVPPYTCAPAATAQVWQWLETQPGLDAIRFEYFSGTHRLMCLLVVLVNPQAGRRGGETGTHGVGATWQEALCRAALALAAALEQGEA